LLHDQLILLALRRIGREERSIAERVFEGEELDSLTFDLATSGKEFLLKLEKEDVLSSVSET
jgi:hypothetical protein